MTPALRSIVCVLVIVAGGCADDEHVPATTDASAIDATAIDGVAIDAPTPDGPGPDGTPTGGVACETERQTCPTPAQICCDTQPGPDQCTGADVPCAGDAMACDGPEDCAASEDCCLWDGGGSRCTPAGVCGNTGAITEIMCHVPAECPTGAPNCCGLAPGPLVDLYSVCRFGGCPQ